MNKLGKVTYVPLLHMRRRSVQTSQTRNYL